MPANQLAGVIRCLNQAVANAAARSDAELLDRYRNQCDEVAFEVLLWRHGPMVLGVCRRLLRDEQDAEDAFQATFLLLVRKNSSIGKREAVGSWLYKVAFRVAMRLKGKKQRQERVISQAATLRRQRLAEGSSDADLQEALYTEINALPKRYRVPVVLCYLQGLTHADIGRELGCPEGTVASRLAWARRRMRDRLVRRGINASGLLGLAHLGDDSTTSCLTRGFVGKTVRGTTLLQAGRVTNGIISDHAVALAGEFVRSVVLHRVSGLALLLSFSLLVVGSGGLIRSSTEERAPGTTETTTQALPSLPTVAESSSVQQAISRAHQYLLARQRNGNWEQGPPTLLSIRGASTSLVLVGLLESGIDPRTEAVVRALEFEDGIETDFTYVLSLQVIAFCCADPQKYRPHIQKNVDRLLKSRCQDPRLGFAGWTYSEARPQSDNSNTHYAIQALDAAAEVGIKIDAEVWQLILAFCIQTQHSDGGWSYVPWLAGATTPSMTSAGVGSLLIAARHLDRKIQDISDPVERGIGFLANHFDLNRPGRQFDNLWSMARVGRLTQRPIWKGKNQQSHDWYREGVAYLLPKQLPDGSWKAADPSHLEANPLLATSFALLFLGEGGQPRPVQAKAKAVPQQLAEHATLQEKLDSPLTLRGIDKNTPLKDVLEYLADLAKFKIVFDPSANDPDVFSQPIRLPKLANVSAGLVLRLVLNQVYLGYEVRDGVVRVSRASVPIRARSSPTEAEARVRKNIEEKLAKRVTLDRQSALDTSLDDALHVLSVLSEAPIVLDSGAFHRAGRHDVGAQASKLEPAKNAPLREILSKLLRQANAEFENTGGAIVIVPVKRKEN